MKPKFDKHIFICTNDRGPNHPRGDCVKCGGLDIRMRFVHLINKHGLKGKVRANKSGCLDVCEIGPAVVIYPQNIWYTGITIENVDEIFEKSILKPCSKMLNNVSLTLSDVGRVMKLSEPFNFLSFVRIFKPFSFPLRTLI